MLVNRTSFSKDYFNYVNSNPDELKRQCLTIFPADKRAEARQLFSYDAETQRFELNSYTDIDREYLVATYRCNEDVWVEDAKTLIELNGHPERVEPCWVNMDFMTNYVTIALYYKV